MKIALLGGNGYIGSSLYRSLSKNHSVDSYDLCLFGQDLGYSKKVNYRDVNLSEYDYIVLLSNHSSVQMAEFSPYQAWDNNVEGLKDILLKLHPEQKLIYISSGSVYGNNPKLNNENVINWEPVNHYDLTKIVMDVVASKAISEGKQVVGLRLGTVNGHSENLRGDLMVNMMVHSARENGVINLSNGDFYRPILGMRDLVDGICCIIESDNFICGAYNLASTNKTIRSIADLTAEIAGVPVLDHGRKGKTYDFRLSTDKFSRDYGYKFHLSIGDVVQDLLDNYNVENFTFRKEYNEKLLHRA